VASTSVIGTYYPVQSFVHKIDARIKILLIVFSTVVLFLTDNFFAFLYLFLFYLVVFFLSNLPASWIYKAMRPVFTILFIAFFFQILFTPGADIYVKWSIFTISKQGIILGLTVVIRILLLVGFASILSYTSTPIELTDAIESLLSPLKILRLPVSEFALVMTIALRFVPQILTEAQDLVKAQKARGATLEHRNIFKRGKALLPLFIPLFVSTYRNAEDLGKAMESRAYHGGKGRTHYKERKLMNRDYLVFAGTTVILVIALLIP